MNIECRICGNTAGNRVHNAREMMFGTREPFVYIECADCGTVQIEPVPDDLAKYYPDNYIAFDSRVVMGETFAKRIAARFAGKYFLGGRDAIGRFVVNQKPWVAAHYPESMRYFPLGIDFNSRILDFGCGNGRLLQGLHYFGFRNLTGADAFINGDIEYPTGVKIFKRDLAELDPPFDLIMLHHSFEHLPDPDGILKEIRRLLAPEKYALIRIPVVNSAWETFGVNWVQLDPPRHLFLYTEKSFRMLCERADLKVERVIYDSSAFQFWGSKQYELDIALTDPRSHNDPDKGCVFSSDQMLGWDVEAETLNREGLGDQACFYLRTK
jgi:SAM-dependent methyltransferase